MQEQFGELAQDGILDAVDQTVEDEVENDLEGAEIAFLGAGGAIGAMAVYKGAQALRAHTNEAVRDAHVASFRLKLSVCQQHPSCCCHHSLCGSCLAFYSIFLHHSSSSLTCIWRSSNYPPMTAGFRKGW